MRISDALKSHSPLGSRPTPAPVAAPESAPTEAYTPHQPSSWKKILGFGVLAATGLLASGCTQSAPPNRCEQVLDMTGGDTGTGVALNAQGDFLISGWRGTVAGNVTPEGAVRWDYVKGAEDKVLDLTGGDTGTGVSVNRNGQFVASGWKGTVAGQIGADGKVSWDWVKGAGGKVLDLTGGDTGTGVALNDQGQFVMSGWRGTVVGQLASDGQVSYRFVHNAEGKMLDLTGGDTSTGVSMNNKGQFLISGWRGTVVGQLNPQGEATWKDLKLDLTGGDTGTGAALNDQGQFVLSGWRGTVAGQIQADGSATYDFVRGADGKVLDMTGGDTSTGVGLNNSGQFLISGWRGTVAGQLDSSNHATFHPVTDAAGKTLDLTGGDTGTGVGLNEKGQFVISGWRGTVSGRINPDGQVSFQWVKARNQTGSSCQ